MAFTAFAGSITLKIRNQPFTLTGTVDEKGVTVSYKADFDKALNLGSIDDVKDEIASIFTSHAGTQIENFKTSMQSASGFLQKVETVLANMQVRITELAIDQIGKTWAVGLAFAFDSVDNPPQIAVGGGAIQLLSIGVRLSGSDTIPIT